MMYLYIDTYFKLKLITFRHSRMLVSVGRIELPLHAPKARVIPFHYTELFVVAEAGFAPAISSL